MPKKLNNLRECVRCHCTKLEKYFSTNTKGELYKTCDHCREQKMTHRENNRNKIKSYREKNKDKNKEHAKTYRENNRDKIKEYKTNTIERIE